MKRNRKRTRRMSVAARQTMHVFGVIVVLFAMVILNMLASSSCTQLQKTIGEKERLLKALENDRERESARWDGMKTLDRLETSLVRLGMDMKYPKAVQIVMMDSAGRPRVAQNSVKEARRRQGAAVSAAYRTAAPSPRNTAEPPRTRGGSRVRR